jgi:hypothetical protein
MVAERPPYTYHPNHVLLYPPVEVEQVNPEIARVNHDSSIG